MNIKLVKLTAEYKKQLTDMMDEWLAVEKDFSPYAIRKNDYHDFEYYLENLETAGFNLNCEGVRCKGFARYASLAVEDEHLTR